MRALFIDRTLDLVYKERSLIIYVIMLALFLETKCFMQDHNASFELGAWRIITYVHVVFYHFMIDQAP